MNKVLKKEVDKFASKEHNTFNSIYRDWDIFVPATTLTRLWVRAFQLINPTMALNKCTLLSQEDFLKLFTMIDKILTASKFYRLHNDTRIQDTLTWLQYYKQEDWYKELKHIPYKEEEIQLYAGRLYSAMNFVGIAMFEANDVESPVDLFEFNQLTQKIYQIAIN